MLVLAVLEAGPLHGYAVIEEIKRRAEGFDLPEGTIYPLLHSLERAGFVSSDWSAVSGRRRRTYHLTRAGRAELASQRTEWGRFRAAVDAVIGGRPTPQAN